MDDPVLDNEDEDEDEQPVMSNTMLDRRTNDGPGRRFDLTAHSQGRTRRDNMNPWLVRLRERQANRRNNR